MKELVIVLSDDTYRYLSFLERTGFIKCKEDAMNKALEFYKKFSMHDWLPYIYRMGGGRVLLMDVTMISDLFHELSNIEIFNAGRATAFKRKVTNPFFRNVDFSNSENWSIVLGELEVMGWGKFSKFRDEVKVTSCPFPAPYLEGYFEGIFGIRFKKHSAKIPDVSIFIADKKNGKKKGN